MCSLRSGNKTELFSDLSTFPVLRERRDQIQTVTNEIHEHRKEIRVTLKAPAFDYTAVSGQEVPCLCVFDAISERESGGDCVRLLQSYLLKSSSSSSALSFWLSWRTRGCPLFRPTGSKSAGEQFEHIVKRTWVRQKGLRMICYGFNAKPEIGFTGSSSMMS